MDDATAAAAIAFVTLLTVAVGALPRALVEEALDRGAVEARRLRLSGLIDSAALSLQGHWRIDAQSSLGPIKATTPRRLDRSAKRGVERPSLHDKRPIVERRSLRSGLRPSVETTEITICNSSQPDRSVR